MGSADCVGDGVGAVACREWSGGRQAKVARVRARGRRQCCGGQCPALVRNEMEKK